MRKSLLSLLALSALGAFVVHAVTAPPTYQEAPNWYKLAEGRTQMGNMHGDIAVSSKGEVYVSTMDPQAALQVYADNGKFLRLVPGAPPDFHGFVIHKDADGTEYIYGPRLTTGDILKLTLDGKEVLHIPPTAIPDEFKTKGKDGKATVRLTAMDVAPDGKLYVTDGYSSDYVHVFDATGKYLKSFGGKKAPYDFKTLHKIAIDTRFSPPRILATDRTTGRMVHMSLDGEFLGVVATGMRKPAAVAVQGDYAVIGELGGQVTVLDKAGTPVAVFGTNDDPKDQPGSNKTEPDLWKPGTVTAPHGVAFNARGDIFVAEYNIYGRVHRFNKQ